MTLRCHVRFRMNGKMMNLQNLNRAVDVENKRSSVTFCSFFFFLFVSIRFFFWFCFSSSSSCFCFNNCSSASIHVYVYQSVNAVVYSCAWIWFLFCFFIYLYLFAIDSQNKQTLRMSIRFLNAEWEKILTHNHWYIIESLHFHFLDFMFSYVIWQIKRKW